MQPPRHLELLLCGFLPTTIGKNIWMKHSSANSEELCKTHHYSFSCNDCIHSYHLDWGLGQKNHQFANAWNLWNPSCHTKGQNNQNSGTTSQDSQASQRLSHWLVFINGFHGGIDALQGADEFDPLTGRKSHCSSILSMFFLKTSRIPIDLRDICVIHWNRPMVGTCDFYIHIHSHYQVSRFGISVQDAACRSLFTMTIKEVPRSRAFSR